MGSGSYMTGTDPSQEDYAKAVRDRNQQAEAPMCALPANPRVAGESVS